MLSLASELTKATSAIELATRLGGVCLHGDEMIRDLLRDPVAERHRRHLESCVSQMDRADAFARALARVEVYPPLEFLAVLAGMLGAALLRQHRRDRRPEEIALLPELSLPQATVVV